MNRKKGGPARFWGTITSRAGRPVTGVDPAAAVRQGGPIELAVEALETNKFVIAIPRKSGAKVGPSPPRRARFIEGFNKFRNLLRDSLDKICPWENSFLGIFTSPINIPGRSKRTAFEGEGDPWGNQAVVRANSSLLLPKRCHVSGAQNLAVEAPQNVDSWVDGGNVFDFSPDRPHNFRRVERSFNFAAEFPDAYYEPRGPYGRRSRYEDEEIEEQLTNCYGGENQDDDLMFRMSL